MSTEAQVEIVAIAHKNVQHMWNLKGKRLCYPGFDIGNDITKVFLTYFENFIIPKKCHPDKTLFENRVYALSDHFEMACIAGPWASDTAFDYKLKSKYRNLCGACSNPAGCYSNDKYYGWEGALICLTDNVGDVAWIRLDQAKLHFKKFQKADIDDYRFLCLDGTTRPLNFNEPCTWISRPWPVIVAKSQKAMKITQIMNTTSSLDWQMILLQLMENYYINPTSVGLDAPDDYLRRFPNFLSANIRSGCRPSREVRWCLTSDIEKRKCNWLRDVSIAYGVEPTISCVQVSSRALCLAAIRKQRADVFMALPEELLMARKMGLRTIVRATTNTRQEMNRIAAVVMKNSTFKILKDLKGARASFTGYKSVGWNVFTMWLKNELGENQDCSDARTIANFFKDSCVLGWHSKEFPSNLYSLCKQGAEQAGDDLSAFEYLTSGRVDVAFVNLKVVEKKTKVGEFDHEKIDYRNANQVSKYRVLGSTWMNKTPYLLAWIAHGSIVAHENITNLRRQEIYSMLLEMDKLFGKSIDGRAPAFSLYDSYDGNPGVIFPVGTRVLELYGHQTLYKYKENSYDQIVDNIVKQEACSAANVWIPHLLEVVPLCVIVIVLS
ncbi:transferrin isoform X2 [Ooceraea biroi]|uniref:transferrin isoform X2 n=1 Tax=Ooceraea biroi TaxID=2015173 RepID=UPI0005BBCC67|nr:transferrin isoform X2 [Ooceraea biroi]